MSFILDALKKSESERQRQSGPGVFQPRIASPRARFPVWAIALGLLLGVNLLILLWVMTRPDTTPGAATAPTAATPANAASVSAAPGAAAPAAAAVGDATSAGAAPPATRFNPPLIVDPALNEAEPGAGDTAGAPRAGAAAGAPFNPNDYVPAQPAAAGATTPLGADAATRGGGNSNFASRDALVARGQNVPEVALSLHVYDPDPAKRFVFVNGQRGSDGDSLPSGLRIEQIVPEGAVLSWNGNRFLVPIQ
jgi:general secretion pathway protein B